MRWAVYADVVKFPVQPVEAFSRVGSEQVSTIELRDQEVGKLAVAANGHLSWVASIPLIAALSLITALSYRLRHESASSPHERASYY